LIFLHIRYDLQIQELSSRGKRCLRCWSAHDSSESDEGRRAGSDRSASSAVGSCHRSEMHVEAVRAFGRPFLHPHRWNRSAILDRGIKKPGSSRPITRFKDIFASSARTIQNIHWNLELIHLALLPVGPTTFRTAAITTWERSISKQCALGVATTRRPFVKRRADPSCISTNCASLRRLKSGGAKPGASSPFGSRKEPRVAHR
jgi:hypothetical protein